MIFSKDDYLHYLYADKAALGAYTRFPLFSSGMGPLLTDPCWQFQKIMRKLEYWTNCYNSAWSKIYILYLRKVYQQLSIRLGFSIHINTFGEGLCLGHYGYTVIAGGTKIGKFCTITSGVTIGRTIDKKYSVIGDNCYIGVGASIINGAILGNNVTVGAGAVVTKSFAEDNIVLAGVPAKIISRKGIL